MTPNSILPDILWRVNSIKTDFNMFDNFPDNISFNDVMDNIFPNYYSSWNEKYIIDRSVWGLDGNLKLLKKHIKNDLKFIILVRNVVEVLASFIRFAKLNPKFFLNQKGRNTEERCDWLMNDPIKRQLESIRNLIDNNEDFLIIEYDDLLKNTKFHIDKIYDFLEIPKFNHDFTKIKQYEHNDISYDDSVHGGNMHELREGNVEKNNYDVRDFLSDSIIEKYSNLNIWR